MKHPGLHNNGLMLDGKYHTATELIEKTSGEPEAWQEAFYGFLKRWFDPSPHINITTSGTTGKPKTIRVGKQQMANSAWMTGEALGLSRGDTALLCLPVQYIAGMMMVVRSIVLELDLTIQKPVANPGGYLTRPFVFSAMTAMQVWEIMHEPGGVQLLEQVDKLLIGGGPLSGTLEEKLRPLSNRIWHTYAMTETLSHIALRRVNGTDPSSYYTPLPGVLVTVDQQQRLVVEAPQLVKHPLTSDDVAAMDGQGRFRILGRHDMVVISGGLKCYPESVEAHFDGILDIPYFITGWPDEKLGEKIILMGELDHDAPEMVQHVIDASVTLPDRRLRPRAVVFVPRFFRSVSGKISRKTTMDHYHSDPDPMRWTDLPS